MQINLNTLYCYMEGLYFLPVSFVSVSQVSGLMYQDNGLLETDGQLIFVKRNDLSPTRDELIFSSNGMKLKKAKPLQTDWDTPRLMMGGMNSLVLSNGKYDDAHFQGTLINLKKDPRRFEVDQHWIKNSFKPFDLSKALIFGVLEIRQMMLKSWDACEPQLVISKSMSFVALCLSNSTKNDFHASFDAKIIWSYNVEPLTGERITLQKFGFIPLDLDKKLKEYAFSKTVISVKKD